MEAFCNFHGELFFLVVIQVNHQTVEPWPQLPAAVEVVLRLPFVTPLQSTAALLDTLIRIDQYTSFHPNLDPVPCVDVMHISGSKKRRFC